MTLPRRHFLHPAASIDFFFDSAGSLPTVIASHLSEAGQQEMEAAAQFRQDALLGVLADHPNASQAQLAALLGWRMRDGQPYTRPARTPTPSARYSLVKWKYCDPGRRVNIDGAAYVVVTSIRDGPAAKSKIEDSSRRRRKCTITLRRNGGGACIRA
jgi:hypothetical protein